MKIRKILALVMVIALAIALAIGFTGCLDDGGGNPGNTGGDDDVAEGGNTGGNTGNSGTSSNVNRGDAPTQLVVYSQTANYSGKLTGWFAKIMLEEFNVEMTIIPQPDPGIFDTRMEMGDLGDIVIFGGAGNQYQRAVSAGMLFDWNEDDILEEFGPYIVEHMPYALEHNADLTERITGERVVYGVGHDIATDPDDIMPGLYTWDIRWDLYKALGYPEINNLDDLFTLFLDMKALSPTDINGNPTYAVSMWPDWDGDMVMYVKSFATAYFGHDEFGIGLFDVETGEFYYATDPDGPYIESLRFFNRLYREGLVDPDSMVQKYEDMSKKLMADGIFFSMFDYAGSLSYNNEANLEAGKFMYSLIPNDATPISYAMNVKGGSRVWSIGANTDYPELCMEIINWLTTPVGAMTYFNGPQGLCWDYDENGHTYFTDYGEAAYRDARNTQVPEEWGGGMHQDGTFQANNTLWSRNADNPDSNGETYNPDFWESRRTEAEYAIIQDWRDFTGFYDFNEYFKDSNYKVSYAPASGYVERRRESEFEIIWQQVTKCIVDESWKAIVEASTEAEFDRIVAGMIRMVNEYDPDGLTRKWGEEEAAIRYGMKPVHR